jgi:predicted HD superfamily hydrolase involved in NAD metabolism
MIDDALLEAAEGYARTRLSDKRYAHTLRVADTAQCLARLHSLDPERARLAALLHDTARELGKEELLRVTEEEGIAASELDLERPILLHGPVAAELAHKDLGIEDAEVREAVRAHTTGEPGMGSLSLVLYMADKIEPDRDQPGVEDLRKLALEDLRRATATALEDSISYNEQRGQSVHPKSLRTLEWLGGSGRERSGEPEV